MIDGESINLAFRSGPVKREKAPGSFRIMVMGGSHAFGSGVHDYEDTFSGLLAGKLKEEYPTKEIEVVNAAIHGFCLFQVLAYYKLYMRYFTPDLVLLYANINDFHSPRGPYTNREMFRQLTGTDIRDYDPKKHSTAKRKLDVQDVQDALRQSSVYNLIVQGIGSFREWLPAEKIRHSVEKEVNPIAEYEMNLTDLISAVRADKAALLLADAFHFGDSRADMDGNKERIDSIRRIMESAAGSEGVLFVPIHALLKDQYEPESLVFYPEDDHLNKKGHRIVANRLFDAIVLHRLLEPEDR